MVRRICWSLLALLLLAALVSVPRTAAARATPLPQVSQPVKIDSALDDAARRDAARIHLDTETRPRENIPATVKTIAYPVTVGDAWAP